MPIRRAASHDLDIERAQRELFHRITRVDRPDEGLRARLGQLLPRPKISKTLPQYAGEVRLNVKEHDLRRPARPVIISVFGVTQLSEFHSDLLRWLGRYYDLRLFHANPLVRRPEALPDNTESLKKIMQTQAERYRHAGADISSRTAGEPGEDLLRVWGAAGAESLSLASDFLKDLESIRSETVIAQRQPVSRTVLHRLQSDILGERTFDAERLPQDVSLQVVACPGAYREIETVHASILHNLRQVPDLKQTDIAVMVTDMTRYRPVIQAVFDRTPQPLAYNLADFSAADLSAMGRAVDGMLELALESFTRSGVFEVILNPCFLTRLGVARKQAAVWLHWAEELGVHHGWDAQDQEERGYAKSSLFGWQLALRRLRLGRIMTPTEPKSDGPAPCYEGVVPHADLWSQDKEQLDLFCRAVEGLLPRLRQLRHQKQTGEAWARTIRRLVEDFLAVPEDLPAEAYVRDALLRRLDELRILDGLLRQASPLPLALIREFIAEYLEKTVGTFGTPLTGGVTIATPELLRGLPFRVVYVLGLGENLFPGTDRHSALDLRQRETLRGDIRPTETNRFLFLEALLAARDKVYLLYDCRELQRDQELHPSSVINQLRRYLEKHVVLSGKLQVASVPLRSSDLRYLGDPAGTGFSDVLVSFSKVDRLVAIKEAQERGDLLTLTKKQERELEAASAELCKGFQISEVPAPDKNQRIPTVHLRELDRFLRCPAEAALRRHLRLDDEDEPELADDEPLQVAFPRNYELLRQGLTRFVRTAVQEGVDAALAGWQDDFTALHDEWRRRCLAPGGAFGDVSQTRFLTDLKERIETAGLAGMLREQGGRDFIGPIQIGAPLSPVGARVLLPPLRVETSRGAALVVGGHDLAWVDANAVVLLTVFTGSSTRVRSGKLCRPLLAPLLFGLALRAGEAIGNVEDFRRRFAGRDLLVCIAHGTGVEQYRWSPDDLPPDAARGYLAGLAEEFLDPAGFDLLPADLLFHDKNGLEEPYLNDESGLPEEKLAYAEAFREIVEEDEEKDERWRAYRPMQLLQIATTSVPEDAFDKVRRRFRFLDYALARARGGNQ